MTSPSVSVAMTPTVAGRLRTPLPNGNAAASVKPPHGGKTASSSAGASRRHPMNISVPRSVERAKRQSLVLWRRPIATIYLASRELLLIGGRAVRRVWRARIAAAATLLTVALLMIAYRSDGTHQLWLRRSERTLSWWLYWVGLGVLSSVGLGTGLHTFLLYLGPHIAAITLAAYECQSVDFPEPPYPDQIVCPLNSSAGVSSLAAGAEPDNSATMSVWRVLAKVRIEAFMWGAGTALGELPPYFMARAARLSGGGGGGADDSDNEDLEEFDDLQRRAAAGASDLSLLDRAKLTVERLVQRVGFLGIAACASVPNPLFDLAGITCGHFLVPFWTFFGATLLGKAVVKAHLQTIFVIVTFNERLVSAVLDALASAPFGQYVREPVRELLAKQKQRLHAPQHSTSDNSQGGGGGGLLANVFEKLVLVMVAYFVVSIINSLAQTYHKRMQRGHNKQARD